MGNCWAERSTTMNANINMANSGQLLLLLIAFISFPFQKNQVKKIPLFYLIKINFLT